MPFSLSYFCLRTFYVCLSLSLIISRLFSISILPPLTSLPQPPSAFSSFSYHSTFSFPPTPSMMTIGKRSDSLMTALLVYMASPLRFAVVLVSRNSVAGYTTTYWAFCVLLRLSGYPCFYCTFIPPGVYSMACCGKQGKLSPIPYTDAAGLALRGQSPRLLGCHILESRLHIFAQILAFYRLVFFA